MNQVEAIFQVTQGDGFELGFHLVWICSDCMNAILADEEQASELDLGTIRIEQDLYKCEIKRFNPDHEYYAA